MPAITQADRQALAPYRDQVRAAAQTWAIHWGALTVLMRHRTADFDDPAWRAAVYEAVDAVCALRDQLPAEPPPRAKAMHAAVVRWFGHAAARAAAVVALIDAGDWQAVRGFSLVDDDLLRLQRAAEDAAAHVRRDLGAWVNAN